MIAGLLNLLKNERLNFGLSLLLACATVIAGIGLMSTSGYLISRAALRPMIVDLFMVTAAVRFFGISRAVVRYFERVVSHDLTFRIMGYVRSRLFVKLNERPLAWLMGRRPGDLLTRLMTDIETLQTTHLRIISPVLVAIIISALTFFALWFISPLAALATLFALLLSGAGLPMLAGRLAKGRGKADLAIKTNLKELMVDKLQGMQDLKWLGQEQKTMEEISALQQNINSIQKKNAGNAGLLDGLNSLFGNLGMFLTLVIISPLVLSGQLSGPILALVTLGVLSSFEAVLPLGQSFLYFENSREAYRQVSAITNLPPLKNQFETPVNHSFEGKNIRFENVNFSYARENITIDNIDFEIAYGSKTAIVGASGSGKSTLVNLLLRFWDIDSGKISIGATDIGQFEPDLLRGQFALVQQDAFIFNRSLRENLLIAKPNATDKELMEVLDSVGLNQFSEKLDMDAGSLGMILSGGERQLLALARALLKDAPIWIFDEPTANLDANTERLILDKIWENCREKTLIMITHRLIDMDKMDQIIVMNQGKKSETGTHSQLLEKKSYYSRMFQTQLQIFDNCT